LFNAATQSPFFLLRESEIESWFELLRRERNRFFVFADGRIAVAGTFKGLTMLLVIRPV
jgi:hypothetical protein